VPDGGTQEGELAFFEGLLAEVLSVEQVRLIPMAEQQVSWRLRPRPEQAGRRSVPLSDLEAAMAGLEPDAAEVLAAQLRKGYSVSVEVLGQALTMLPDEVAVTAQAQPGWAAANDDRCLVVIQAAQD
jgi:hypothetical protein